LTAYGSSLDEYRYRIFGLGLASAMELPELDGDDAPGEADVAIEVGSIPDGLLVTDRGLYYVAGDGWMVIEIPGAPRYLVEGGRRIVVEAGDFVSAKTVRIYLLGSVLAALCQQRGLLPLHANAVVVDGRAYAFGGESGMGKSTLAARFHDAGFQVLADDVCVVSRTAAGEFVAWSGIPRVKLWRDALEASGRVAAEHDNVLEQSDKYHVRLERTTETEGALPFAGLYALGRADRDPPARIERLRGAQAVTALMQTTYRPHLLGATGKAGLHMQTCVELAQAGLVYRFVRRWGHDRFDTEFERLREHLGMRALEAVEAE
jgi:hypothetical protein